VKSDYIESGIKTGAGARDSPEEFRMELTHHGTAYGIIGGTGVKDEVMPWISF
jgi:hypothetical protein